MDSACIHIGNMYTCTVQKWFC